MVDIPWTTEVRKTRESFFLPDLIPSFPLDEYIENKGFTLLHEIVCHLNCGDLDSALQTHSADVNKLNVEGESPLEMAVSHENIAAVRTLLKRGADPNICDGAPMCAAMRQPRLEVIDLLLRSGAVVHGPPADKWVSLLCDSPEDLPIDRLLIEHGLNVNHQAHSLSLLRKLCLGSAQIDRIEQLIGLGADLELRDPEGYTALHCAAYGNRLKAMKILLYSGARIDVRTNQGDTIAHLAVIGSQKIWIAKAISKLDLGRLDLNLKNEDGHTVYDLLRKRNGLRWEVYHAQWSEHMLNWSNDKYLRYHRFSRAWRDEYGTILALEALLHHIQDLQGIPKEQQYPPLGKYLSDDKDEDPVPGAWPV